MILKKTEMVESGKKRMRELELENAGLARQRRKVEDAAHLKEKVEFYQRKEHEEAERKAKEKRREEMIEEIKIQVRTEEEERERIRNELRRVRHMHRDYYYYDN